MEINDTLKQRGGTHGEFEVNSQITEDIMDVLRASPNWKQLPAFARSGIYIIVHKLARAVSGDYSFLDHWHDIQGYAKLVHDRFANRQSAKCKDLDC